MVWPITWPASVKADELDPNIRLLCETYASHCMTALTLHRVGGNPVTIMPAQRERVTGYHQTYTVSGVPLSSFHLSLATVSSEDLLSSYRVDQVEAIELPGPVGDILQVRVDDITLPSTAYQVEDGRYLVRVDGGRWPTTSGDHFTVTYRNSHPVDEMGSYAAGVLANEWLTLFTNTNKKCRLPSSATSVSRQGISIELATGMFPQGVTGLPEIDAYLMLWNPFGLKVAPKVYSPDMPQHRQVWHA